MILHFDEKTVNQWESHFTVNEHLFSFSFFLSLFHFTTLLTFSLTYSPVIISFLSLTSFRWKFGFKIDELGTKKVSYKRVSEDELFDQKKEKKIIRCFYILWRTHVSGSFLMLNKLFSRNLSEWETLESLRVRSVPLICWSIEWYVEHMGDCWFTSRDRKSEDLDEWFDDKLKH